MTLRELIVMLQEQLDIYSSDGLGDADVLVIDSHAGPLSITGVTVSADDGIVWLEVEE